MGRRALTALVLLVFGGVLYGFFTAPDAGAQGEDPAVVAQVQHDLRRLGLPVGSVDGIRAGQTERALCAVRVLHGFAPWDDRPLTWADAIFLNQKVSALRAPAGPGTFWVSRTCQIGAMVDASGRVYAWVGVSTGRVDAPTPVGRWRIHAADEGWIASTLFPQLGGVMYRPRYFLGWAYAVHGSWGVMLPRRGAGWSNGCVRVHPGVMIDPKWLEIPFVQVDQ